MNNTKILYVDDESINLMLLKLNFRDVYEVVTIDNPEKGLEILDVEENISIVISDMKMPQMTGIEFIKKAKVKYPAIKYFILTGFELTSEIEEALKEELILGYFKKPFKPDEIIESINKAISLE